MTKQKIDFQDLIIRYEFFSTENHTSVRLEKSKVKVKNYLHLDSDSSNSRVGSAALFASGRRRQTPDVVGWGGDDVEDEDDTACLLSNDELRQEQRRVIREQDEGAYMEGWLKLKL